MKVALAKPPSVKGTSARIAVIIYVLADIIVIEGNSTIKQIQLLQQLEEDKTTIFKLIDKMLTNKKFKDFFAKNVATL